MCALRAFVFRGRVTCKHRPQFLLFVSYLIMRMTVELELETLATDMQNNDYSFFHLFLVYFARLVTEVTLTCREPEDIDVSKTLTNSMNTLQRITYATKNRLCFLNDMLDKYNCHKY